jgi:osmoprotectant transport system permease protein
LILVFLLLPGCGGGREVVVGSKADTETALLGELATLLIRDAGTPVRFERKLGGTALPWQALVSGRLDLYPEYTGTLRHQIFSGRDLPDDDSLRAALAEQGVGMTAPLGFANNYAIGMRAERAAALGVTKISDLRAHPEVVFGFSSEFVKRADGWEGLKRRYGLNPTGEVRGLDHLLAYQALAAGQIDATDVYTTDAEIARYNLRVLDDDLSYFPQYRAVFVYRLDLERRHPRALAALRRLEGRIPESAMMAMNARAQAREPEARVAADFLTGQFGVRFEVEEPSPARQLLRWTGEHLALVGLSLTAAILTAVPLGVVAAARPRLGQALLTVTGLVQTIPSLALFAFLIPLPFLGLGTRPAVVALFLYSLLPILRNTYTGLRDIPPSLRESAEGLGLAPAARLRLVELPLASRSILAGIKTAAVINVGTATLGALIGAGGLGQPILTGLQLNDWNLLIWQGAVPTALLALAVQGLFEVVERAAVPRGLRLRPTG